MFDAVMASMNVSSKIVVRRETSDAMRKRAAGRSWIWNELYEYDTHSNTM